MHLYLVRLSMRKMVTTVDKTALDLKLVNTFFKAAKDFCNKCDLNESNLAIQAAVQEGTQWRNITDLLHEKTWFKGNLAAQAAFNFDVYTFILSYSTEERYSMGMGFVFSNAELQTVYGFEELNNVLSRDDFRCHFANQLISEERLLSAFDWLTSLFLDLKSEVDVTSADKELLEMLLENRFHDQVIFEKRLNAGGISLVRTPAIDIAYQMIQKHEFAKALNALRNIKGDLTIFESRLFDFLLNKMSEAEQHDDEIFPPDIAGFMQFKKQLPWEGLELLFIFLSLPFAFSLCSLLFIGVYFLYSFFVGGLYIIRQDIWLCVIFGVFASGFLINPIKKILLRVVLKKKYFDFMRHKAAHPDIIAKRILIVLGITLLIGVVFFFPLFLCSNVVFYEDGMTDNTKLFSLSGAFVSYEDIECIYHVNAFLNDYGDVFERPSVAIKLINGRLINLRQIGTPDEEVLLFLQRKSIPMAFVEFIEDIE